MSVLILLKKVFGESSAARGLKTPFETSYRLQKIRVTALNIILHANCMFWLKRPDVIEKLFWAFT